jgi:hypothetical protein
VDQVHNDDVGHHLNTVQQSVAGLESTLLSVVKLGSGLLGLVKKIIMLNMAIYNEVVMVRTVQASRLERPITEEYFVLEDAVGRIDPVQLRFIDSWDAFNAVLATRFKGRSGANRVSQRHYTLQEHATGREINQSLPWSRAVLPGQKLDMSILCRSSPSLDGRLVVSTCPRCQMPCEALPDTDIDW